MKLQHTLLSAMAISMFSGTALAEEVCNGHSASSNEVHIPVFVDANRMGGGVTDYSVSLGALDEFDLVCISDGMTKLVWSLEQSDRYQLRGVTFDQAAGSISARKWVVGGNYAIADIESGQGSSLKYTLVIEDQRNGALVFHDPRVSNED